MRILSLNAWGGALFEPLAEWLPRCGADVICLQEVTHTPNLGGWTRFVDAERTLPQRANLFNDVQALLPDYQGLFVASDAGPVVAEDGQERRQDFGIASFVHKEIPIVGQATGFVHGSFVDHAKWPIEDRPRTAHAMRIFDRRGRQTLTVAHLHGLRDPLGKSDTPSRRKQAQRLALLLSQVRKPEDFTVVCGDMNLLPDSETFELLGKIGLVDLVGESDTRSSLYPKPIRHANYLLVSHPEKVSSFEVLSAPEVLDHRALLLEC